MRRPIYSGFSLVEMAVVLAIIGLLLAGMLLPLGTQIDQQNANETQRRLETARDALLGFVTTHRRLPCPASATSNGVEVVTTAFALGGGVCDATLVWNGYIPAVTLGLLPVNSQQLFVDTWGNPIRYAVTNKNVVFTISLDSGTKPFTSTDGIRAVYSGGAALPIADLNVCNAATAITNPGASTAVCSTAGALTSTSAAVIFSTGKNSPTGGIGTDEAANLNGDPAFVSHTPTPSTATGGEFDDVVLWLSPYLLYNRMILSGALP